MYIFGLISSEISTHWLNSICEKEMWTPSESAVQWDRSPQIANKVEHETAAGDVCCWCWCWCKHSEKILKENGSCVSICTTKPLLTTIIEISGRRLQESYAKKGPQFWHLVLFTDETRIAIHNDSFILRVRRKTGERQRIVTATVKHLVSVMLWGSFAAIDPKISRVELNDRRTGIFGRLDRPTRLLAILLTQLNSGQRWSTRSTCPFTLHYMDVLWRGLAAVFSV